MANPASEHRRKRTWKIRYTSRINECYWKRVHSRRELRANVLKCVLALAVFGVSISPVFLPIGWGPAIATAAVALVGTIGGHFYSNVRTARVQAYCRQWSELFHDADTLWDEGETRGWGRSHMESGVDRLNSRMGEYQKHEMEDQNNRLVDQCQREFYRNLNAAYPPDGGDTNG